MIVPDVNVLVALFRADHEHHEVVARWWRRTGEAGVSVTAPDLVWTGFVRIVTSSRVFRVPATVDEAFGFVKAVTAQPTYVPMGPLPHGMDEFERLCRDGQATGDFVPDAYVAAVARCLGAAVATLDRDFRRFDDLRLAVPS